METETLTGAQPKTDEDYKREIDQMALEIRAMLDNSRRDIEIARRIGEETDRILDRVEQHYLCGQN